MRTPFFRSLSLWGLGYLTFLLFRYGIIGLPHGHLVDDAYITLRYVSNLLNAGTFHWNVGAPIFGITTLLYPMLISGWSHLLFWLDLETAARFANLTLEYLSLIMATQLFKKQLGCPPIPAFLLALATLSNVILLSSSSGGMEAPLFILLLLTLIRYIDSHPSIAMTCAGLLYLTRPEGILLLGLVGLLCLWHKRWSLCLLGAALFSSYHLTLWLGYGSYVPASVEVKSMMPKEAPGSSALFLLHELALLIPLGSFSPWARLSCILPLMAVGVYFWPKKNWGFWVLGAFTTAYFGAYALANPPMWFWYGAPFVTMSALFFFYGSYALIRQIFFTKATPVLFLCVTAFFALSFRWAFFTEGTYLDFFTDRIAKYHEVVEDLKENYAVEKNSTLLTHEIGLVGFRWPGKVLDAVGLVNPQLAHLGWVEKTQARIPFGHLTKEWITLKAPDFILIQEAYVDEEVRLWPQFHERYELLYQKEGTHYSSRSGNLEVYKKRSFPRRSPLPSPPLAPQPLK